MYYSLKAARDAVIREWNETGLLNSFSKKVQ